MVNQKYEFVKKFRHPKNIIELVMLKFKFNGRFQSELN